MNAPLAVYDTMVLLQAAANRNWVHASLRAIDLGIVQLCMSEQLLDELQQVLLRPATSLKFPSLTSAIAQQFVARIRAVSLHFATVPQKFTLPQHPDDDHLFNLAIHAGASFLVTWEKKLLALTTAQTAPAIELRSLAPALQIVSPADLSAVLPWDQP